MTKPHQEEQLQNLYRRSKASVKTPAEVNKNVLAYARRQRSLWFSFGNWQSVCALCLVVFVWIKFSPIEAKADLYQVSTGYSEDDQVVYYHHINFTQEQGKRSGNRAGAEINQDQEYMAYVESLSKLQDAHRLQGIVKQSGTDMVVEVCQLGLIKVSFELLQEMDTEINFTQLQAGQGVLMLADNQGKLVGIEQGENQQQCAE